MVKICTFYGLAKSAFMVYHPSINRCKKGRRVRDRRGKTVEIALKNDKVGREKLDDCIMKDSRIMGE